MKLKVLGSIFALGAALAVAQPAPAPGDDVADGHRYFVATAHHATARMALETGRLRRLS